MNVTPNHTATPWRAECWTCHAPVTVLVDDASHLTGKRVVAECEREEDAAFVVKAANAHDKIVEVLKAVRDLVQQDRSIPLVLIEAALLEAGEPV